MLNAKRLNKPGGISTTQTPRRFNPASVCLPRKQYTGSSSRSPYPDCSDYPPDSLLSGTCTLPRRTNKLSPPSLSLSYDNNQDNKYNNSEDDTGNLVEFGNKFSQKGGSKSRFSVKSGDSGFEEMGKGEIDMNIKNTKNKLNLQFTPDKINRPKENSSTDIGKLLGHIDHKITREINGNESKTGTFSKPQGLDEIRNMEEEDESSRSESEISVLELSSFIDLKESEKDAISDTNDETTQAENNENKDCEFNTGMHMIN